MSTKLGTVHVGGKYVVTHVRQEAGRTSRLTLEYWPGRPGSSLPQPTLLAIAGEAHLAADEALETPDERRDRKAAERSLYEEMGETDAPSAQASEKRPRVDLVHMTDPALEVDTGAQAVYEDASLPRAARLRTTPPTPTPGLDAQAHAGEENQDQP